MTGFLLNAPNKTAPAALQLSELITSFETCVLYNDTDIHALPIYLLQATNAQSNASLSVTSAPWPFSAGVTWDSNVFTTVLLLGIALTVPAGVSIVWSCLRSLICIFSLPCLIFRRFRD